MGNMSGRMVVNIKENSKIIFFMEKEYITGIIKIHMMEIGRMEK